MTSAGTRFQNCDFVVSYNTILKHMLYRPGVFELRVSSTSLLFPVVYLTHYWDNEPLPSSHVSATIYGTERFNSENGISDFMMLSGRV